jgi:hypothetical protein
MAATVAYALSPQQNDGDQSQPVANHGSSTDHQWYHLNISYEVWPFGTKLVLKCVSVCGGIFPGSWANSVYSGI